MNTLYGFISLFNPSSVGKHPGFQFSAILNTTAMNICLQFSDSGTSVLERNC